MNIGYIRVSTVEQNMERQLEGLKKYHIDKFFEEKISGKNTDRPQLQAMLEFCRDGDTIYVHDFSRLARSTKDLLDIVELLNKKGVHLVSNKENIKSNTPQGKLMLTMIGAIYEFERTNLLERQREGIEIAKSNGVYKGRSEKSVDEHKFNDLYEKYIHRQITKSEFAIALGVSRPTLNKILKNKARWFKTILYVVYIFIPNLLLK